MLSQVFPVFSLPALSSFLSGWMPILCWMDEWSSCSISPPVVYRFNFEGWISHFLPSGHYRISPSLSSCLISVEVESINWTFPALTSIYLTEKEIDVLQLQKHSSPDFLLFGTVLIQGCDHNGEDEKTYIGLWWWFHCWWCWQWWRQWWWRRGWGRCWCMKVTSCDVVSQRSSIILNHWSHIGLTCSAEFLIIELHHHPVWYLTYS